MEKFDELDSPQPVPGLENPPLPWKDKKHSGKTVGEMLTDKIGGIIEKEER